MNKDEKKALEDARRKMNQENLESVKAILGERAKVHFSKQGDLIRSEVRIYADEKELPEIAKKLMRVNCTVRFVPINVLEGTKKDKVLIMVRNVKEII